jgi:cobaltochelatase CobT
LPHPQRTIDAISACSRALGAPDADVWLATADAATVGGLRAFGDRLAARRRWHDAVLHQQAIPQDPLAAEIFEALELARLDTLGSGWLPGIARNLLAHPGAADDGVRWLAFEAFSGRSIPDTKHASADRVRRALSRRLAEQLGTLARQIENQAGFTAAAAELARQAAHEIPRAPVDDASANRPALPVRTVIRDLPGRGDPGGSRAPLARRAKGAATGGEGDSPAGAGVDSRHADGYSYRAFTTAHDRIVNAAALARREELTELRLALEADLASLRTVVSRVAKRLMRTLMAQQTRHWRFDLEEGQLDGSRLAPFIASRGGTRPFKQETDSPFPSTVVSLLIDHSGSMRGRPMRIAALTVELFVRVLERCGVRCEVLGFTTREWDGGEPAREWAASGYPEAPGRLNALEHIVIKSADVPWRRARIGLGIFLHDEMLKENIDGEALAWAHRRLLTRPERRRILVVVSDGTPMDEATLAANGYEYLDRHLVDVVHDIETRSPVQLAAIGIGHDVSRFYRNATRIRRIDDLGPALTAKLIALLGVPEGAEPR